MRLRMSNMPGVVAWLIELRDHGPAKRHAGRAGVSARNHGLTDFWVRHRPSGRWMPLSELRAMEEGNPRWYATVDYGEGLEAITQKGLEALAKHLG